MMTYVHQYPCLSARGTPDHACLSILHASPLTHTTSWRPSPAAEQRCRRDMNNTPQRCRRITNITPQRRPFEHGRKPIGRSARESAYRLSSRPLGSPAVVSPPISVPIDRFIAATIPTIISPSATIIVSPWPTPAPS